MTTDEHDRLAAYQLPAHPPPDPSNQYAKEVTLAPLLLDDRELADLVEFLRSLDDGPALPAADFPEGLTEAPQLP